MRRSSVVTKLVLFGCAVAQTGCGGAEESERHDQSALETTAEHATPRTVRASTAPQHRRLDSLSAIKQLEGEGGVKIRLYELRVDGQWIGETNPMQSLYVALESGTRPPLVWKTGISLTWLAEAKPAPSAIELRYHMLNDEGSLEGHTVTLKYQLTGGAIGSELSMVRANDVGRYVLDASNDPADRFLGDVRRVEGDALAEYGRDRPRARVFEVGGGPSENPARLFLSIMGQNVRTYDLGLNVQSLETAYTSGAQAIRIDGSANGERFSAQAKYQAQGGSIPDTISIVGPCAVPGFDREPCEANR